MKRKNIITAIVGMLVAATVEGSDDTPVFSTVDTDYFRPVGSDALAEAPFANVRWINAAEGDPSLEAFGVWDGQVEIHIVNARPYQVHLMMIQEVDDAVDSVITLFAENPTLGENCLNAWVANVEDTPTDLSGKIPVKTCRITVMMKFKPGAGDDEAESET